MTGRIKLGGLALSWCLAAVVGSVLSLAAAAFFGGGSTGGGFPGRDAFVQMAMADVGKGDYIFFPSRLSMWVINRTNGKVIHYVYYDNQMGTVEHSRVSAINQEWFPLRDTDFMLSERNLTSFLWVVNRVTGTFQVWRANHDHSLSTDQFPVPAGEDLQVEAMPPSVQERGGVSPNRRPPASSEDPAPAPAPDAPRKRSAPSTRSRNS